MEKGSKSNRTNQVGKEKKKKYQISPCSSKAQWFGCSLAGEAQRGLTFQFHLITATAVTPQSRNCFQTNCKALQIDCYHTGICTNVTREYSEREMNYTCFNLKPSPLMGNFALLPQSHRQHGAFP